MNTPSNYDQFTAILAGYPEIRILDDSVARTVLDRVMARNRINDLHYLWSMADVLPVSRDRIRPRDLPDHYAKTLPRLFSGDVWLIMDCCDGRFIVCRSRLEDLIPLLQAYSFELVEIYIVNATLDACFCVNHAGEVFLYDWTALSSGR